MTIILQAKSELLQGYLVDITQHHKGVETNSPKIAQNEPNNGSDLCLKPA